MAGRRHLQFTAWNPGPWVLYSFDIVGMVPPYNFSLKFKPATNFTPASVATGPTGTASLPLIISRIDFASFAFYDADQSAVQHFGTDTQEPDPTLVASVPDAPAHRGLAHI